MVAPESMALVVRQRGGPNLIVHTLTNTHYAELTPLCSRGIPGSLVNRACEEAVTIMGRFALGRGQTDVDGSGDIHPKFAHDKLLVLNGRYAVVYRLVFKVWVMAVTTIHASALVSVRLVEAATKGLVTTCQVLEVDNEVIARNYPEVLYQVHFMMGAILKYQGADLQKAQAEALANIYSYIADTREKKGRSSIDASKRPPSARIATRSLSDFNGGNQKFDFQLPADFKRLLDPSAIPAPSVFTFEPGPSPVTEPTVAASQTPFDLTDLLPNVAEPIQGPPATQQFSIDDIFGPPAPTAITKEHSLDLFSSNASQQAFPFASTTQADSKPSDWLNFGSVQKPIPAASVQNIQGFDASSQQQRQPLLYLMERWEGEFDGSTCIKSSAWGEVGLRKQIWRSSAGKELKFSLSSGSNSNTLSKPVRSLMKCVKLNPSRASVAETGVFSAKVKAAPAPYLKYRLLSGMYDMPLNVCVASAMAPFGEYERCMILLIQLASNPYNRSVANGSLFAWIPRQLGQPIFARPSPHFSKRQSCLKWNIQNYKPNQSILFKAVLPVTDVTEDEIVKSVRVELNCIGVPGTTYSGVTLSQEKTPGDGYISHTAEASVWTASLTARP